MLHLVKLALAIKTAQIRNAEEFVSAINTTKNISKKDKLRSSLNTSPTEEEQRLSERGVSFGDQLDLSIEPSTEYLN